MPGYDLHTHTLLSDGTTTPEQNVERAVAMGLDGLAVTDHDTTAPWERALTAAAGSHLEIVPGVELSAEHDGGSVHVLGYWFGAAAPPDDHPDWDELQREMDRVRNERERRAEEIVAKFNALGVEVSLDRVRALAGDSPVGRPHIAQAVVETGAAEEMQQVFDQWLYDGGPAYVPKYAVGPVRATRLLVAAGAVPVLAHPGLYGRDGQGLDDEVVAEMVRAGLAGVEADHPDHPPEARDRYRRVAAELGLVVTAGSDFHGDRKDLLLGEIATPRDRVEALRARLPVTP